MKTALSVIGGMLLMSVVNLGFYLAEPRVALADRDAYLLAYIVVLPLLVGALNLAALVVIRLVGARSPL